MFVIVNQDMYYSLNSVIAQSQGIGGWASDADKALGFARDTDAKEFISKFLLGEAHRLEVHRAA